MVPGGKVSTVAPPNYGCYFVFINHDSVLAHFCCFSLVQHGTPGIGWLYAWHCFTHFVLLFYMCRLCWQQIVLVQLVSFLELQNVQVSNLYFYLSNELACFTSAVLNLAVYNTV
jgi:hypothetical protein